MLKLVLSLDLQEKLVNITKETLEAWNSIGCSCSEDIVNICLKYVNKHYPKMNIKEFEFRSDVIVCGESSTYFGVIEDEQKKIVAYVFVIPPKYETRSGVLAQQVFPVMSGIIPQLENSPDFHVTNKPVLILNMNEAKLTSSGAINILSAYLLNFMYVDVFDRDYRKILLDGNLFPKVTTILDYHNLITQNSKKKENDFFEIDTERKVLFYLPNRLKDGISVNNEPYWFVLKAYASLYLALNESYTIDMTKFDFLSKGNKTLDTFRSYVNRFN